MDHPRTPIAGQQQASPRTPLFLVEVGHSTQFPVPCAMSKVPSGLLPAPARSPLVLTFRHRRRLRLLGPFLSFEAGAPAAPEGPSPSADSINSPGSPREGPIPAARPRPGGQSRLHTTGGPPSHPILGLLLFGSRPLSNPGLAPLLWLGPAPSYALKDPRPTNMQPWRRRKNVLQAGLGSLRWSP